MNREFTSNFSNVPYIEKPRSKFYRPQKHLTTGNAGRLIPIYVDEVLPGDTHNIKINGLMRMLTPIYPTMDDAFRDLTFFYVPSRIVWDHAEGFIGDDSTTAFETPVEYEIPQIEAPSGGWAKGTIADYMGIPTGIDGLSVNALPFRALAKVFNDWWRDENLTDECMIHKDDTTRTGSNGTGALETYVSWVELGGPCPKPAKMHDYFTSALPGMQKGPAVLVPIAGADVVPVFAGRYEGWESGNPINALIPKDVREYSKEAWKKMQTGTLPNTLYSPTGLIFNTASTAAPEGPTPTYDLYSITNGSGKRAAHFDRTAGTGAILNMADATNTTTLMSGNQTPVNLWADTAAMQFNATVNELRTAFAIQRILEAFARGGTRYTEILRNIWGVSAPDFRLQRSEFLGSYRVALNIDQVLQTSESNRSGTPLGETGAFSNTRFSDHSVEFSSFEHGYIIGLACVRIKHTYQQGLERMWTRKSKWDFYWPQMAYLSEQAIRLDEIYAQGTSDDETVFGYQERWAEYRYKPNRVSGEMRSTYAQSLDSWHYADYYTQAPSLSNEWISEGDAEINRTLAVQSNTADQFLMDFYIENVTTRMMPVYSVPGLLDHF